MKPPIHLQTKEGFDLYKEIFVEYLKSKDNNTFDLFKQKMIITSSSYDLKFCSWMDDHMFMEQGTSDFEDWKIMSDKSCVFGYFAKRTS